MTTMTAKLASGKLNDAKGITDEIARRMYDAQDGQTYVAIVELGYAGRSDSKDDKHTVTLEVAHLELVTDPGQADSVREIARSLYRGRVPTQLDLDSTLDDVEPGSDEYIARAKRLIQCEVCLHAQADKRIKHAPDPDADSAFCTWEETGTEVLVDEEHPPADAPSGDQADSANQTEDDPDRTKDLAGIPT